MGYRQWVTERKDMIQATAAMVTATGFVLVSVGLYFSYKSTQLASEALKQQRSVEMARVYMDIQNRGIELSSKLFGGTDLMQYIRSGKDSLSDRRVEKARHEFGTALAVYYMAYRQYDFETISKADWELMKRELCMIVNSEGGKDYLSQRRLEEAIFLEDFKKEVRSCDAV